jgi:hypothetical protein
MKAYLLKGNQNLRINKGITKVVHDSKFISELQKNTSESVWVTNHSNIVEDALRHGTNIFKIQKTLKNKTNLLIFDEQNLSLESTLASLFKTVFIFPKKKALSIDEILEILMSENPSDLVIGGFVKNELNTLVLTRGDLSSLVVPLNAFRISGDGIKPNFYEFSITDGGQTLRFGKYEASVDSILYEYDSEYRKKLKNERSRTDKTLAACLRRLRLQKGFLQSDFPDVDEKVIGRIEQEKVKKPHATTLKKIAKTLGVEPEDIMNY